jgi:hypothetical protein
MEGGRMTTPALVTRLFDWKIRGVRWVEIIGVVLVAAMIFSVYIAKTAAARESSRIDELNRDIAENRQRVRLLRAEISRLEQPSRLEALSREAGLAPIDVHRQATEGDLPALKPAKPPVAAAPAPKPAPAVVAEDPGAPL